MASPSLSCFFFFPFTLSFCPSVSMHKHFPFSHFPIPVVSIMWFKASYRHNAWEPMSRWDWHSVALARWFGFESEVFFSFPSSTRWDEQTLACKDLANMVFGEENPADAGSGKTLILAWKFMWFCELNSSQTLGKEQSGATASWCGLGLYSSPIDLLSAAFRLPLSATRTGLSMLIESRLQSIVPVGKQELSLGNALLCCKHGLFMVPVIALLLVFFFSQVVAWKILHAQKCHVIERLI